MQAVIFDLDDTLFAAEGVLHEGVVDLLAILHRLGVKIGALASGDHRVLVRLSEAGIAKHFDNVLCSDHLPEPKDPQGVLRLMNEMGVERHQVALVSHAHRDIVLGKHAGLAKTIRVAHGPAVADGHFAPADHIVEDIPGVLDVLE
ncbi:MAG TPA: HAD family hydrolase [Patescibacteria group bacterium]|nr:HAD family hydrolase [Patescibacteria group bacterium]